MKIEKGFAMWITGLPCSGKTTLAKSLQETLQIKNIEHIDGDEFRKNMGSDLSFSRNDRARNIMRASYVANLLQKQGIGVVLSFISPYQEVRDRIRAEVENVIEVYLSTPVESCEERDVKGMYKKARSGEIKNFTGIDGEYEPPTNPDIEIDTSKNDIVETTKILIDYLLANNFLTKSE